MHICRLIGTYIPVDMYIYVIGSTYMRFGGANVCTQCDIAVMHSRSLTLHRRRALFHDSSRYTDTVMIP